MFEPESLRTSDFMLRVFRLVFNRFRVSKNDFVALHSAYRKRFYPNEEKQSTDTHRNNMRTSILSKDRITWVQVQKVFAVLGLRVVRVSFTVQVIRTGEMVTVNSDDPPAEGGFQEKSPLVE